MNYENLKRDRCPKCGKKLMRQPMYRNWKCSNVKCDFRITQEEKIIRMVDDGEED